MKNRIAALTLAATAALTLSACSPELTAPVDPNVVTDARVKVIESNLGPMPVIEPHTFSVITIDGCAFVMGQKYVDISNNASTFMARFPERDTATCEDKSQREDKTVSATVQKLRESGLTWEQIGSTMQTAVEESETRITENTIGPEQRPADTTT